MTEKIGLDTILINCEAVNKECILETLGLALMEQGHVHTSYVDAVKAREIDFPTGLNVAGDIKIAIPHADSRYVKQPQVAFASLKNPVLFNSMENPDESIPVRLVFMLAVKDPTKQVVMLQRLMAMFQNHQILKQLVACQTEYEAKKIIESQLNED